MYSGVLSNYATLESVLTAIGKAMDGIGKGKQCTGRRYSPKTMVVFNQLLGVAGPSFVGYFSSVQVSFANKSNYVISCVCTCIYSANEPYRFDNVYMWCQI